MQRFVKNSLIFSAFVLILLVFSLVIADAVLLPLIELQTTSSLPLIFMLILFLGTGFLFWLIRQIQSIRASKTKESWKKKSSRVLRAVLRYILSFIIFGIVFALTVYAILLNYHYLDDKL